MSVKKEVFRIYIVSEGEYFAETQEQVAVFVKNFFSDPDNRKPTRPLSIGFSQMTEEEYNQIPATNESAKYFGEVKNEGEEVS